jgi:hypothetical protein
MSTPNITNAKYVACPITGNNDSISCQIGDRHCSVPLDPDNTDYQAILEWASQDGNTIQDAD